MCSKKDKKRRLEKTFAFILILAFLFFLSCEELTYSPSGENKYNIDPPELSMELNLEEIEDTAYVWGTVRINYRVNTYGKEFTSVECYLDSEFVSISRNMLYLEFNSRNHADGAHSLILLLTAKSGTGSLADKLGLEYVVMMKEIVMVIQNEIPPTPVTPNIETSSGYAKLSWTKYPYSNFKSYKIYTRIFVPPYNYYTNVTLRATIENKDSTEWIDDIYAGGDITYTVDVTTTDGTIHGNSFRYVSGAEIMEWNDVDRDSVNFKWSRCPTDSTFDSYELYIDDSKIAALNNINDTTATARIGFGRKINCFVKTVSKNSTNQFLDSYSPLELVYIGSQIPEFQKFEYIPATNSIYLTTADSSFRLNAATSEVMAKGKYAIDVCFDGTRGYAYKNLLQIVEIDPGSLNEIRTINLQDLLTSNNQIVNIFTGTPNIVYCNMNRDIRMIDIDDLEVVSKMIVPGHTPRISQSSPQGYLINVNYGINSSHYIVKVDLSLDSNGINGLYINDPNCVSFSYSGNLDMIINTYNSKIWTSTHNGNNYVTIKEFIIPANIIFPSRDPVTGMIGGFTSGFSEFVIYDVNSQSEFKRVKVSKNFANWGFGEIGKIFLLDSKVYSTFGTFMELE